MAGVGPAPKDPSKRARRNKDVVALRVVEVVPDRQPSLVDAIGELNPVTEEPWKPGTLLLWKALGEIPTTRELVTAQWLVLARAMILDDALLSGKVSSASEARLQLAKFGIAPDDVARMRYSFAQAAGAELDTKSKAEKVVSSRDRMRGITRTETA